MQNKTRLMIRSSNESKYNNKKNLCIRNLLLRNGIELPEPKAKKEKLGNIEMIRALTRLNDISSLLLRNNFIFINSCYWKYIKTSMIKSVACTDIYSERGWWIEKEWFLYFMGEGISSKLVQLKPNEYKII